DALTGVANANLRAVAYLPQLHVDLAAFRRELDRVQEQVRHDLLQPGGVALDEPERGIGLRGDADLFRVGDRLRRLQRIVHDVGDVDGRAFEPQLARDDARDVEQIVDELRLPARAVVDRL